MANRLFAVAALSVAASCSNGTAGSEEQSSSSAALTSVQRGPDVQVAKAGESPPLALIPPPEGVVLEEHEPLRPPRPAQVGPLLPQLPDPAVQAQMPTLNMPAATLNFSGEGFNLDGACAPNCSTPPDPNGAVGPNHFVQVTNQSGTAGLVVWSKTGTKISGPTLINSLFSSLGATDPCFTRNDGDPVVVYDGLADRWFITQFSLPNQTKKTGPSFQCVAVSKTPDPTGTYAVYEFSYPFAVNDYGKFGIWPDGYYATYNQFTNTAFAGADFCVMDRSAMVAGSPTATQQCFLQPYTAPGPCPATQPFDVFGALPVSLEGKIPPPVGEPGYFMQFDYSQCGPNYNQLDLWSLHVDFVTPANTVLTGPTVINVSNFTPTCNNLPATAPGPNCVPQGGSTVTVDGLSERVMFRLAYRNFGQYESLTVNHSVMGGNGGSSPPCPTCAGSGVRWYELHMPLGGGTPTVAQQSTFAPADTNWRFMGSMAQDQANDMAIGYAITSSGAPGVAFPSIAWAGRINTDPVSTLGQAEAIIDNGSISEGDAYPGPPDEHRGRWGDYSNMTVDPSDDCTFWYTQELYINHAILNPVGNWDTAIASTKFANCAAKDFSISVSPASANVTQGSTTNYTVTTASTLGTPETITLWVQNLPTGVTGAFVPTSVTAGGSSTLTLTAAATAPVTATPDTFMVIGKATSAVHDATAQVSVVAPSTCGAAGQPCCSPGNTCTSNACLGGVCCTAACTTGGTCGATACNGSGACIYPTTQCVAQSCTAGVQTNATNCANGTCPTPTTTNCSPYVCGATACKTTCATDADCISGDYCNATNHCVPKGGPGSVCTGNNACTSNVCFGGFCCTAACTTGGTCGASACNATGACVYPTTQCVAPSCTAGVQTNAANCANGTCPTPTTTNCTPYICGPTACKTTCATDADCISGDYCNATNHCVPKGGPGSACTGNNACTTNVCFGGFCCTAACTTGGTCGASACNATGACVYPTTQCVAPSCTGGVQTNPANCANGTCPTPTTTNCTPYICGPTACKTTCATDADCISGDYCNAGACVPKGGPGSVCGGNNACSTNVCFGGFCCGAACTTGGTCGATACDGTGACVYPTTQCVAPSCTGGVQTNPASCSNGTCPTPTTTNCAPYVCGPTACKTSCASNADCVAPDVCNGTTCGPAGSPDAGGGGNDAGSSGADSGTAADAGSGSDAGSSGADSGTGAADSGSGSPDGGSGGQDSGVPRSDAGANHDAGQSTNPDGGSGNGTPAGCGCGAPGGNAGFVGLLLVLGAAVQGRRPRRRVRSAVCLQR